MPRYSFAITANVTMTAQVEVEADSIEDAQQKALAPSFYQDPANARFELDDDNQLRDVYLPDAADYRIVIPAQKRMPASLETPGGELRFAPGARTASTSARSTNQID